MPELITHTLAFFFIARRFLSDRKLVLFLIGTMLPDLVSRPFNILLLRFYPLVSEFTLPLHSPLVVVLYCLLLCYFIQYNLRKQAFLCFLVGSFSHLSLDYLQKHIGPGYLPLFPFSRWYYENGLFWSEYSIYSAGLLAVLFCIYWWRRCKTKTHGQ
jgi:hypothetical protein